MPARISEIAAFGPLLDTVDLDGHRPLGPRALAHRNHWIRDVTYGEDHFRVRTRAATRTMASLRNLAISALRLAGGANVAQALRHMARNTNRPLPRLGITT